ncbi:MAG: hypothetical protein IT436_09440 [Phycisphaerales bacterium]|nr:hypothetical protein [Phycisphaerales bacterium]
MRPRAIAVVAVCAGMLGAGCGGAAERPVKLLDSPAARAGAVAQGREILPVAARVDVITGVRSVVAVTIGPEVDTKQPVVVKLDDGRSPPALLRRIEITPEVDIGSWAPPAGVWRVLGPADVQREGAAVVWVLAVDLPPDGLGQGLWVNGKRWELNWAASPEMLAAQHPELRWESPVKPEARASPMLAKLVEPDRLSPARRWRYRLAMDGLRSLTGREASIVDATSAGTAFEDPLLESLAEETDARWAAALANLRLTNPDVARRLAARLALVVEFTGALGRRDGSAIHAPAWVADQDDLERLVSDLLDPNLPAKRRAARASAWLEAQAPGVGWVVDDARAGDAVSGASLSTVGIANLTEVSTLGWVALDRASQAPGMTPVGAAAARAFTLPGERAATAAAYAEAQHKLTFHAGSWKSAGTVMSGRLGVMPPGLTIGPLLPDWTMADWAGASKRPMVVEAEWATAAMLFKGPPPVGTAAGARGSADGPALSGWTLYIECRRPVGGVEGPQEFIRVWLGPTGRSRLVVRAGPEDAEGTSPGVHVVREAGRWALRFDIPGSCIEPDGTLRLGLERGDARGVHSAWPRRMLPWQSEPGRLAIDTGAWSGISAERE